MYRKLIQNDIRKSKLITAAIAAFILASALLTSLAAMLAVNLFGAVDNMLAQAKTPHFTRMHAGEMEPAQIEQFAAGNENIEQYQVQEYLNIEGAQIVVGEETLGWSAQDNGFSVQSDDFDFLLDLDGEVIHPADGEVYFPLYYMKTGSAQVGDTVRIHGVPLTVAGFLRDSLMNPAMASSKRFLVSENDFEKLRDFGIMEYLIEFRLHDPAGASTLESEYIGAGLPANGPLAITPTLVLVMNGMEDGIMIAVLILISLLVILVSFLCIRFTLLAKIEEDYREIGVLKAIGLRVSTIRRLYMAKYGAIAGVACVLGFVLALALQGVFAANIRLYVGVSSNEAIALLAGLVGAGLIFLAVMLYIRRVLGRFKKISAAQAIRFGAPQEKSRKARGFRLSQSKLLSTNAFLALKDVLSRKKLYITMLLVVVVSAFIVVVPQNLYTTISSRNFFTNMGIGLNDFSIYVSNAQTEDVLGAATEAAERVASDESVSKSVLLATRMFEMPAQDGAIERLQVSLGDHSVFPITYAQGRGPQADSEIALSTIYADDFGKNVGDTITLMVDGQPKALTVCGVYSDVTNSGKTAKAMFTAKEGDVLNAAVWVALQDPGATAVKVEEYKAVFPLARVLALDEVGGQVIGGMASAIRTASLAAIGIAALLTVLVTLLFLKMLTTKDRYPIAVLKSLGFTSQNISRQYMLRAGLVFLLGVVLGTVLANTLGEYVGLALISFWGVSSFHFTVSPLFAYLFAPLLLAACVLVAMLPAMQGIRRIKVSENIREG